MSLEQHPDYAEYIFHPMDLCTLEKVTLYGPECALKLNKPLSNNTDAASGSEENAPKNSQITEDEMSFVILNFSFWNICY